LLLCVTVLAASPSAFAAEPTVKECLDAYEASLTFKNEDKLPEALSRLEVCSSVSCPMDIKNECVRRTGDLQAALAAEKDRQQREAEAAKPPPAPPPRAVPPSPSPHPIATAIATPPPVADETPPFYTRWWFWTGAAVVVAGGVTTALILSRPETPQLSGIFPNPMRAEPVRQP
jgi:hypothetical protein